MQLHQKFSTFSSLPEKKKLFINCYSLLDNNPHFATAITRYEESPTEKDYQKNLHILNYQCNKNQKGLAL